jgi:hypothetical protein
VKKALQLISGAALAIGFVAASTGLAGAQSAHQRSESRHNAPRSAVFVQTDNLSGNQVVA